MINSKIESLIIKWSERLKNENKYTSSRFYNGVDIPDKKKINAIVNIPKSEILLYYDATFLGSGNKGYIFTVAKIYCRGGMGKKINLKYDEIESASLSTNGIFRINSINTYLNLNADDNEKVGIGFIHYNRDYFL